MADVLQTVLQLVGGGQYVAQLNKAAQAHQQLAVAQQRQAAAQRLVQGAQAAGRSPAARQLALAGGGGPGGVAAAGGNFATTAALAAVAAVAIEVKAATESFLAYDRAVISTQFTLQRMGQALPSEQFTRFARSLSLSTGTAETDLVNLQGYLARFGTDAPTIARASRTINDAAILTGHSVEEMAMQFEMARKGHAKEFFKELGIPIRGVEGQLYDLNQIVDIVDRHIHGFGEKMGKELPGQINRAKAATQVMQDELGRLVSPITGAAVRGWAWEMKTLAAGFWKLSQMAGIPTAGAHNQGANAAFTIGGAAAKSRSEDYLRRIELNTGPQGALGRALRAGGSYAEPGAGMPIRDLQMMFRHHR